MCTCVEGTLQTCVQCDSHQTKETPPEQTLNKEIDALQHPVNDHQHRAINPEDCLSAASHPSLSLSLYILSSSLYSIYIYIHCYLTIYCSIYIYLYMHAPCPSLLFLFIGLAMISFTLTFSLWTMLSLSLFLSLSPTNPCLVSLSLGFGAWHGA